MSDEDGYILEDQIGFLLRKANQRHRLIFTTEVAGEIAPAQFSALAKLHELGTVSQNQLGRLIALDSATIKGVVDRLSAAGLVSSQRSPNDARLSLIGLTAEGRRTIERLLPVAKHISDLTVASLTEREAATLTRLLAKISS
ncbi:MAG: MarR family winged helix-turn-helix transcriptional regulator [Acidimicrobiales bacterium]